MQDMKRHRTLFIITAGQPDNNLPLMNELKRPLSRRGVAEVLTLLEDLKEHPIVSPELILCSPSLYVRQTLDLLHEILGSVDVICRDTLYAAPDYRILDTIKSLDDIFETVMLVGELPGLTEFVNYVSRGPKGHTLRPAEGTVLTLDDNKTWHTFGPETARRQPLIQD